MTSGEILSTYQKKKPFTILSKPETTGALAQQNSVLPSFPVRLIAYTGKAWNCERRCCAAAWEPPKQRALALTY